jgi:hypothetical protein
VPPPLLTCFPVTATATCSSPQELAEDRGGLLHRGALGKGAPSTPAAGVLARGRARLLPYSQVAVVVPTRILTLLPDQEARDATRPYFDVAVTEFARLTSIARPEALTGAALDGHVSRYLDHLFREGFYHERRDKLLAALLHLTPELGRAAQGSYTETSELDGAAKECPALPDHIGETTLHTEALLSKERRKNLEARAGARVTGAPLCGGAGGNDMQRQSPLDKTFGELKCLSASSDKAGPSLDAGQAATGGGQGQ